MALDCGTGREITARLAGFDTPEARSPGCEAERALANRATARLRALVAGGVVKLSREGVDRYRRPLMRLELDGRDVGAVLVGEGLAVAYAGGRRIDWCARVEQ